MLLYTARICLAEYREKLMTKHIPTSESRRFVSDLLLTGTAVALTAADVPRRVPADPDDDVVVACAIMGQATHLVTYDPHIHALGASYQGIRILDGLHFLYVLRGDLPSPPDTSVRPHS